MPAVSFAKKAPSAVKQVAATPVEGVTVETTTTIAAPATPAPPATPECSVPAVVQSQLPAPRGLVLGDKIPDFDDIILPRLNISQQIGELKDTFSPGSVVFNQAVLLFSPPEIDAKTQTITTPATPPVTIVCLGFRPTRFVEQIGGGARGMIVNTEQAVRDNGGTLDYNEHQLKKVSGMKYFQQLAEALIAIERPQHIKDDDTVFVYPVAGKKYALALWGMKGTAFTAAAKRVFFTNRAMGCLRKGYPSREFSLATIWKSFSKERGAWVPVLTPLAATSPEFLAWVSEVLQSPVQEETATAE